MAGRHRVLIVEDDSVTVDVIREIIEADYQVMSVGTGLEALWTLPRFRPDIILLDINMPGMDGYEVCRRIRADQRYQFTKIILVSGRRSTEERLRGYDVGADDYVTKPFVGDELRAKVNVFAKLKYSEEVDGIKENLIRLFSRETGTPLTTITGSAELLLGDETLSEQSHEMVEIIRDSGATLQEFVRKTMALCRLKGGVELAPSRETVSTHIYAAAEIVAGLDEFRGKNLRFRVLGDQSTPITADWGLMGEALRAMLDTAVRFSPEDGEILVEIEVRGGTCSIAFSDNGPEIKPENAERLFHEFAVPGLHATTRAPGLSLAIARAVAELHGGDVVFCGAESNGARFAMKLPTLTL